MLDFLKTHWKKIALGALVLVLGVAFFAARQYNTGVINSQGDKSGVWYIYPTFDGYQTKYDPSKVSEGANPQGQNTTIFDGDRIGVRQLGYDLFPTGGTLSTTTQPITSLHTFRKRDGENILMRSYGTVMEYYEEGNDSWETLRTGYTSGYRFGYADYNINTDLTSYVYFGNSQEMTERWTGQHTLINGTVTASDTFIPVDSTAGFLSTTGTIIYCGTEATYASTTPTRFNLSSPAAVGCANNRAVAEATMDVTSSPKGNILLAIDNRLWVAGITTTPQAVYFSRYGNPTDFISATLIADGTDTSPGIFNLGEGGGGVVGMTPDESSIYIFKKSTIRKATLNDTIYTLGNLKPFDGKSQTTGATAPLSTFTSDNAVFFVTPDKQIMMLSRVEQVDYPQITPISDPIEPTVAEANFDASTGITFKNKVYFAAKSTEQTAYNDAIFVFNLRTGKWDSPIIGWNVADWAIYDDGTGEALYFGDATTNNVYQVNETPTDYIYGITSNWRSKQNDFGLPHTQKQIDSVYVEGYIGQNTTLTISLLLDENGFTQTYTTEFSGTESAFIYNSDSFNLFGFHAFGRERFGSNDDQSGGKKFRVYLNKSVIPTPFYNAQIEFASDGEAQNWEITNFGFKVRPYTQESKPALYRIFQ